MITRDSLYITPERSRIVREEITEGSEPRGRFYILVVISTMIASFGLVMNSTAVVIGAMLVAPLMTPIFGIALALIRSDAHLLGRAGRAEIAGVVAAILMGFMLGKIYPGLEATPEMLARTKPQLFDLLVAIFSGFAGAFALVDEKISPALPGVAIATAIVPPLANTGLCFAVGAYAGGVGSFLLFFSNFLAILLVASLIFWFFGMTEKHQDLSRWAIVKRFSLPIAGFFLITAILTQTLLQINQDRRLHHILENVLREELANLPSTYFDKMIYRVEGGKVFVFAHAHSSLEISPTQVSRIQARLVKELNQPTELTIQNKLAHTVSALDAYSQVMARNLDGRFIKKDPNPRVLYTKIADSVIRNYLVNEPATVLLKVLLLQKNSKIIVSATFLGLFNPKTETVRELELLLREKLEQPDLNLIVRFLQPDLYDRDGRMRLELTGFVDLTTEQKVIVDQIKLILKEFFTTDSEFSLDGIDYTLIDGTFNFFLRSSGTRLFPIDGVDELERLVMQKTGQQINISVVSSIEAVATSNGYQSYGIFSHKIIEKLGPKLKNDMKKIIENSDL